MGGSGRSGLGSRPYRRNRALLLATNNICALCGHPGAKTADHIITDKDWPRDENGRRLPGFDDLTNLQPAHGTLGNQALNPCPVCGKLCNQARGNRPIPQTAIRSRDW